LTGPIHVDILACHTTTLAASLAKATSSQRALLKVMFNYLETRIRGTASTGLGTPPNSLLAFYWHFVRQTKFWYGAMLVTALSVAFADMSIPLFIGRPLLQVADTAVRHNVLMPGATSLVRWQSHWHVVRQSWPFFQNDFAGRIANRVMQTANSVRESVMATIRAVLFLSAYGISSLGLMLWADWRLAMPTMLWIAAYVVFLRHFVPKLRHLARESSEARSLVMARVVDSYANILTVKLFSRAVDEDAHVREVIDEHQAAISAHMRVTSQYLLTLSAMNALLIPATAIVGILLWSQGLISAAVVATSVPLAWQIANMSGWVSFEIAGIFENVGAVQDGMQSISVPHTLVDAPNARPLEVLRGEIRFDQVDFAYDSDRKVLHDFNLAIRPGERIGVVGRSGAGKSTLVNLLLRFHEVQGGRISIDGQDIRAVTQESLRAAIGMVTQDTSLLHRSIAANIRYGRPQASQAQIEAAARKAQAHDFIEQLVDWLGRKGYEAHVGERGVKLSGGQRQRVALARVILKDAPILILDEATSALDSEIEVAIQEQLINLMDGKTVIAIAHRLSTIARMDRLIVLDQGRIVEQGTHDELLALNGHYALLWRHQSGGFLKEEWVEEDAPA
jgi:ATP-binding cassette, subfamily B, multidrug efflux pump